MEKNPAFEKIDELMTKKQEHFHEMSDKTFKLLEYIQPYISGNKEMEELVRDIRMDLVTLPLIEMTAYLAMMTANNTVMELIQKDKEAVNKLAKEMGIPDEFMMAARGPFKKKDETQQ